MRSSVGLGVLICAALTAGRVAGQTLVDSTAVSGLSTCALQCADNLLAQYDCRPSQSCFCDNADVRDAWTECLQTGCSYSDQLEASRYRADTCDAPQRDRSQLVSIVAYVLFGIATVCLLARLTSRLPLLGGAGYGWDDFMALLCLAPLTGLTVAIYYSVKHGEGKEIWTRNVDDVVNFHKWFYIASVLYVFVVFGTKISLVLLYLRVWSKRSMFRVLCWIPLALLAGSLIAFEVATIVQCRPIASQWTRFEGSGSGSGSEGRCVDRKALLAALSGVNIAFDVLLIVLPIRHFIKTNGTWTKRIEGCFFSLVGLAVLAMSIARVFYIHYFTTTFNSTYYYSFIGLYSAVEAYLSQIWCSLPGIDGLARRLWGVATNNFKPLDSKKSSREPIRISAPLQTPESNNFPEIHTPREITEVEKAQRPQQFAETNYFSSDDDDDGDDDEHESAPFPVVQRSSYNSFALKHQSSFEPIIEKIEHQRSTFRSSATTAAATSSSVKYRDSHKTTSREPEISYHDPENHLHLAIHDPPDEPLVAQLQYVDQNAVVHDLELHGPPVPPPPPPPARESSTRPNTAPSQSYSTTNYSDSSISTLDSSSSSPSPGPGPGLAAGLAAAGGGGGGGGGGGVTLPPPLPLSPRLSSLLLQSRSSGHSHLDANTNDANMMAMAMAMMTMPSLNGLTHHRHGRDGQNQDGRDGQDGQDGQNDRPTMDDRSKSEEEKLADLANAHQILTEEGMGVSN